MPYRPRPLPLVLQTILAAVAAVVPAAAATSAQADYERLLEWRFAAAPTPVAAGAAFERGPATWTLESGSVRLQEPTSGGAVTGAVFEGQGRFRLEVADPVERQQVRRFVELSPDGYLEAGFRRMVLRVSGGAEELLGMAGAGASAAYEKNALAAERHGHWLEHLGTDVDARVIIGLLTPGSDYLLAAFETDRFGWLVYEHDPRKQEESSLRRFKDGVFESWISLDLVEAASAEVTDTLEIRHADIRADLTAAGKSAPCCVTETHPRHGRFSVELTAESNVSGPQVLPLSLRGDARVQAVRVDGQEVGYLRHHIGGRSFGISNEIYDDDLTVLLPAPLEKGDELRIAVDYELEIYNYVAGRGWYPGERLWNPRELHTGTIELTLPAKIEARAMGRRERLPEGGRENRVRWVIDRPAMMLTFAIAERAASYELDVDGAPHIEVFGPGMGKEAKFHNVAADAANSMRFFSQLFGMPLDSEEMTVASIVGFHGQSFYGFIHMAEGSFYLERPGASELFRAHEVAHQWWGHRVSWDSYRDQWLSEAFAEYSAMMYVQATMENGEHWFDEILDTYTNELTGSIKTILSKFARPGLAPLNPNERAKMGPIALGYRAQAGQVPGAYFVQTYQKGSLVLHMLRVMLRNLTKSDDLFVKVLSDFLREYDGGSASTEEFIASLTKTAPGDWQWFFDQWVYGTAIPTYAWNWKTEPGEGGKSVLAITVRQENVPDGFRMPVPVAIDFGGGQVGQAVVLVDERQETFRLPLPAAPKKVQLNPDHAVLAQMRGL
jgi:hypothetical protein